MGMTDWDAVGNGDKDMSSGAIKRIIGAQTHIEVPAGEWSDCRTAAATSLSAFRAWIAASSLSAGVKAWWAARPDAQVEAARQGALLLAA